MKFHNMISMILSLQKKRKNSHCFIPWNIIKNWRNKNTAHSTSVLYQRDKTTQSNWHSSNGRTVLYIKRIWRRSNRTNNWIHFWYQGRGRCNKSNRDNKQQRKRRSNSISLYCPWPTEHWDIISESWFSRTIHWAEKVI